MLTINHSAFPNLLIQIAYSIPIEDLAGLISCSGEAIDESFAISSFVNKIASYVGYEETLGSTLMLTTVNCAIPDLGHAIHRLNRRWVNLSVTQELMKQAVGGRNDNII
ncbi:MAG: hypothetical protein OFPI_00700 [Osedax symbiont Rs2]|nr:MAG: hypothetical protein OFPI_00700 [Osedax symbiont Rs2]